VYTYDSKERVTEIQRYPTGKSNAEDACQRVMYYYDTNPVSPTYSTNSIGRLTVAQYSFCHPGPTPNGAVYGSSTVNEMYTYHAAGAITGKQLNLSHPAVYGAPPMQSLGVAYTYDPKGSIASYSLPFAYTTPLTYTYSNDSMGRPVSITDNVNALNGNLSTTWAENSQYDAAGRMTSLQYFTGINPYTYVGIYTTQTTVYNPNGQVTSLNWTASSQCSMYGLPSTTCGPSGGISYSYSATQNDGQVAQVSDSLSGETIAYQYDLLKRLTSASSSPIAGSTPTAWTQTYQYDGFANLTAKVLNGTTAPIPVNSGTNQLSSAYYDANGNMTSGVGATFTYDEANRIASSAETSGGIEYYGYAPDNKRVYRLKSDGVTEEYTFYGAFGEKLGVYGISWTDNGYGEYTSFSFLQTETDIWFAGKLVLQAKVNPLGAGQPAAASLLVGGVPYQDRLGTNRASGARFYPFGDEITSTSNDRTKFGTYNRDSYTGLDYADQRYYAST
jgi:YD repeat-containing protein